MQYSTPSLTLEEILTLIQEKMQQLLHTLKKETSILENNDIEELKSITLEKIALTEQIEKGEQQRVQFLSAKSLKPNEPAQWLNNNKLISLWGNIKILSEEAQKQNQINGLVINGNRRRVQTQIEILSTSSPAVELTYSSSGENINQHSSNTLAHA
ncbi:MAG: flagellar protein FlgN [Gammaproteobacteria bacterium]|nr:flagellar protein FlgN [Gammaproteobacteria bacterium]MDH5660437.1 flagellar protein FlgN [Gammaproteobacteria bacterium]